MRLYAYFQSIHFKHILSIFVGILYLLVYLQLRGTNRHSLGEIMKRFET